ncbi:MAG: response regulator [Lachnospiraceae bacterium]|nr:response regulator [Lachnospiraceae bacterium]MDY6351953.1 response regulator [Lachnospiraceae bacterium]
MEILIVDDEAIERKGLIMLLRREKLDCHIREASNGKQALSLLSETRADLMLTDIKMPFMDGLELTEICAERYPEMKMVIFSGYGEFEYARKAMQNGITNYILKPVDPAEFHKTIEGITKQMYEEALESENRNKRGDFILEHVLLTLVNGVDPESLNASIRNILPDDFAYDYSIMVLLSADHDFFGLGAMNFGEDMKTALGREFTYLNIDPMNSLLLFSGEISDRRRLGKEIAAAVEKRYGTTPYIAVSEPLPGGRANLRALSRSYEDLETLMENRFYLLDTKVFISGEDVEGTPDLSDIDSDLLMKQIRQDINLKDMVGLREHYERLCDKYRKNAAFSQIYVKFVFSNLMKEIYDALPKDNQDSLSSDVDRLYRTTDFSEVMNILDKGISLLESTCLSATRTNHREIDTVKKYIYENYDRELSIEALAEKVYMAPSYLSHVFKKETGQTLSKFIKSLRMEKAKQLLTDTHEKIVNISASVGYPNVSYFCKSFREYYGVSPQKYRDEEDS